MGMEYKKIHLCLNDCILYNNEYEDLRCLRCGLPRYKVKVGQNDEIDYSQRKVFMLRLFGIFQ